MNNSEIDAIFIADALKNPEEVAKQLTVTSNSTVQPAVLLRLGIFVPGTRSVAKGEKQEVDVSSAFSSLEFSRREGYDQIVIRGGRLNITTDFSVWMGIIAAFSMHGISSNTIRLPFTEFAKLCGVDSRQCNARSRKRIFDSLAKIGTKVVQFHRREDGKRFFTHLLKTAELEPKEDVVLLQADERLWEIYQADYTILLRKHPYHLLKGKEVAQTLYTYIASLPDNPAPIAFSRIRERLLLTSAVPEQTRMIKMALESMAKIEYIEYSISKKGKESFLHIHKRNKKLKAIDA
ncbi:RepB family plasmid replication initiator protein [Leclercia adecarboxylata]|uniref:RepB family plasmid replication initiator protein n=1 Tax=Leclercia adecarboxylata TaxID=83655 RepID=UPI001EF944F9|nr:RepB family plasmid replication initiator protein [Leclercia adecarboxylata]